MAQGSNGTSAGSYPIARGFGLLVLAALVGLILLRQAFGSIRVEAGVK